MRPRRRYSKIEANGHDAARSDSMSRRQSSVVTSLFVKARMACIVSQSGRTRRRLYRLTLTRDRLMAVATSSSLSSCRAMKTERCIANDCTPDVQDGSRILYTT